jgi:hypothetical protein
MIDFIDRLFDRVLLPVWRTILRLAPAPVALALRRLAYRIRTPRPGGREPQPLLIPSPRGGSDGLTVLVLALGQQRADLRAVADALLGLAARSGGLRPVLVTDCDAFGVLRERGLLFEYLPPRGDWDRHIGGDYERFLAERTAELVEVYRPRRMLVVGEPAQLERLPAGLVAVPPATGEVA